MICIKCADSKFLFLNLFSPYYFNPFSKMVCSFSLKLNMANRRYVFLELWARKLSNKLNNYQKNQNSPWRFRCCHLAVIKCFSQLYKLFILQLFRYLQFKPHALHRLNLLKDISKGIRQIEIDATRSSVCVGVIMTEVTASTQSAKAKIRLRLHTSIIYIAASVI